MGFDSEKRRRRSVRLQGYDYGRAGWYYVTICTWHRECIFGEISGNRVMLSPAGEIVKEEWIRTGKMRPFVYPGTWVVMPNHFHGIIGIWRNRRGLINQTPASGPLPKSCADTDWILMKNKKITLGHIIRSFKARVTCRIRKETNTCSIWQRNYYEHIIRNKRELERIREYIRDNPAHWKEDRNHPGNIKSTRRGKKSKPVSRFELFSLGAAPVRALVL